MVEIVRHFFVRKPKSLRTKSHKTKLPGRVMQVHPVATIAVRAEGDKFSSTMKLSVAVVNCHSADNFVRSTGRDAATEKARTNPNLILELDTAQEFVDGGNDGGVLALVAQIGPSLRQSYHAVLNETVENVLKDVKDQTKL